MAAKPKIVLVGAGGHGRVVAEIIRLGGKYELFGAIDPDPKAATTAGLKWLGKDDALAKLRSAGVTRAAVGLGSIGDSRARAGLRKRLAAAGFELPSLVHPSAIVSKTVSLGDACQVMAGALLNPGVRAEAGVVINTGAVVEHDCRLAEDSFVGPSAVLGGDVVLEEAAFVGIGATVLQGIRVGAKAIVGAGAVVVRPVPAGATVVGVPAAPLGVRR
ncbi:MAG: acetyltransferase [Elusimicrobia bacterium]|nr:acetyltransferase [Elusimicrobiota bacterium]